MVEAKRAKPKARVSVKAPAPVPSLPVPEHVAILGLGPSLASYVSLAKKLGGRRRLADETWAINALGDVIQCDRIFHMDDVRVQEIRAAALPESNIATMLAWLKTHPGPIYTSFAVDGYPGLVEFPLEAVIDDIGHDYFNNTAAYAVAYAVHIGVKKISLFGLDYTYANVHGGERGRANVEFLLGIASARGIRIAVPNETSLLDSSEPEEHHHYGYDAAHVKVEKVDGHAKVTFTPKVLPSAAEIEARYDHSQHPSALMRNADSVPQEG
jgi:hypothetical protein